MTATPLRYIAREFQTATVWEIRPQMATDEDPYLQVDPRYAQWFATYAKDADGTWVHYQDCDTFSEAVRAIAAENDKAKVLYLGGLVGYRTFTAGDCLYNENDIRDLPNGAEFFDGQGDLIRKISGPGLGDLEYVPTDSIPGCIVSVDEIMGTYSGNTDLIPVVPCAMSN